MDNKNMSYNQVSERLHRSVKYMTTITWKHFHCEVTKLIEKSNNGHVTVDKVIIHFGKQNMPDPRRWARDMRESVDIALQNEEVETTFLWDNNGWYIASTEQYEAHCKKYGRRSFAKGSRAKRAGRAKNQGVIESA